MNNKLFAVVALCLSASAVSAQSAMGTNKPFSFGGALGAALPVSDLGDAVNTGYNGTLILGINTPSLPIGFRVEGGYNSFGIKGVNENVHIVTVTGNAVFNVPTTGMIRPYVIGGAGLYNSGSSVSGSPSSNDFGFNVGAGVAMPLSGFNAFVEARYNYVNTDGGATKFVPIVFGVMF